MSKDDIPWGLLVVLIERTTIAIDWLVINRGQIMSPQLAINCSITHFTVFLGDVKNFSVNFKQELETLENDIQAYDTAIGSRKKNDLENSPIPHPMAIHFQTMKDNTWDWWISMMNVMRHCNLQIPALLEGLVSERDSNSEAVGWPRQIYKWTKQAARTSASLHWNEEQVKDVNEAMSTQRNFMDMATHFWLAKR